MTAARASTMIMKATAQPEVSGEQNLKYTDTLFTQSVGTSCALLNPTDDGVHGGVQVDYVPPSMVLVILHVPVVVNDSLMEKRQLNPAKHLP